MALAAFGASKPVLAMSVWVAREFPLLSETRPDYTAWDGISRPAFRNTNLAV
jgi:hypothetical protein